MKKTNETENKTWLERHGWKVAAGLGVVMIGGGLYYLKKKTGVEIPTVKEFIHRNDIAMPEPSDLGKLTMLWDEGDGPLFAADDIKIKDISKFVEGLQKHLEGVDPKYKGNDMISIAVAGFHTKEV